MRQNITVQSMEAHGREKCMRVCVRACMCLCSSEGIGGRVAKRQRQGEEDLLTSYDFITF